jgi:hypothetical protein
VGVLHRAFEQPRRRATLRSACYPTARTSATIGRRVEKGTRRAAEFGVYEKRATGW